jgi:hypothetical protein
MRDEFTTLTPAEMAFRRIIDEHLRRYPALELSDLYKLAHQAGLGAGHAVLDPAQAQAWLERELSELGEGPAEPLEDPISGDGQVLRIHLRPYLAARGDPARLLTAFLRTANEFEGSKENLREHWAAVERLAYEGGLNFGIEAARSFWERMQAQDFSPISHSRRYRELYKPAYRVVGLFAWQF